MNQDSVAAAMAAQHNVSKGSLLDRNQNNLAVRVAKAEAIIINQTKDWMKENGIDLEKLERRERLKCKRSHTLIIIKNIPFHTKEKELRDLFERYGVLKKLAISPFNTLALVEMENEKQTKAAMKNLQNYSINFIMPMYLEYAPMFFSEAQLKEIKAEEEKEEAKKGDTDFQNDKTVFVKNLNFTTNEEMLEEVFKEAKLGKIHSCKIIRNTETQLSRGYGFVELESAEAAKKAIKKLQNFLLEEHALKLSFSKQQLPEKQAK